ncbi:hypothetical protein [Flavobacterium gelatinilyticum]|uniref:hypothetical protein n=1 Tax=Flavobacterium gelatinilyticum TaxID=3003260 RepID=UPI0024807F7A|nr:hypothetical protein [Flavobacterium gelatinilyticum]
MGEFSVNSYKEILETLCAIELEDGKFREKRFWICLYSIIIAVVFLIIYAYIKENVEILYSGDTVKVFLIPIFSYLFMSLQEDSISERKVNLYEAFKKLYQNEEGIPQQLTQVSITNQELSEIIRELIKQKML